jgi:hypothetical protein
MKPEERDAADPAVWGGSLWRKVTSFRGSVAARTESLHEVPPGGTNAGTNGTVGWLRNSKKADAHHAKPPDLVAVGLVLLLLLNQVFAVWVSDPEAVPNSADDAQWLPSPL